LTKARPIKLLGTVLKYFSLGQQLAADQYSYGSITSRTERCRNFPAHRSDCSLHRNDSSRKANDVSPFSIAKVTIVQTQGRVWKKVIASYQTDPSVISTRLFSGRTIIHVHADSRPMGFDPVEAELEDVYFATLAETRR
jgi:hypothetical protein